MKFVYVDGIIGAGKSTFIPRFVEYLRGKGLNVIMVKEPVDEWKSSGMLEKFYSNIEENAYEFHIYALTTIYENLKKTISHINHDNTIVVCERGIHSVKYFFVKNLLQYFSKDQIDNFNKAYDLFEKELPYPHLFIWLDTPIATCQERVRQRARLNESSGVSVEYQHKLWSYHQDLFGNGCIENVICSPSLSLNFLNPIQKLSDEEQFVEHLYKNLI